MESRSFPHGGRELPGERRLPPWGSEQRLRRSMQQMQSRVPSAGSLPHGGQLVDRRLDAEEAAVASGGGASLVVTPAEAADLRALATGAYSPLVGFMGAKEHESVTESMRLPDGTLWPIPVCLGIPDGVRVDDGRLALRDEQG